MGSHFGDTIKTLAIDPRVPDRVLIVFPKWPTAPWCPWFDLLRLTFPPYYFRVALVLATVGRRVDRLSPFIVGSTSSSLVAAQQSSVAASAQQQQQQFSSSTMLSSTSTTSSSSVDTGYLNAADAAALDGELMATPGFTLEQLMELAGLSVAEAVYQVLEEKRSSSSSQQRRSQQDDNNNNNSSTTNSLDLRPGQ